MYKRVLKKYEDVALSNIDILKLLDYKANIVLYPELFKYRHIDELLEPYGAFILLFEIRPKYGHWTCVFKVDDNTLEFFNPYGGYPDDSLEYIPDEFREKSHQDHTYLTYLLLTSPYDLTYNEYAFQQEGRNIRTCGRHCVVRVLCRSMDLDTYYRFLKAISEHYNLSFDEIVTWLTLGIAND